MDKEAVDEILGALAQAPDSQIDTKITQHLKSLIGKSESEIKTGVMYAMDMCVAGALASDFGMKTLDILHKSFLNGKDEDFNDENCPWRKDYYGEKTV